MSIAQSQLAEIASKHGVNFDDVQTLTRQQRRDKLADILARDDVPFPIQPERREKYLADFDNDVPFAVGALSDTTVDLGEYANSQNYEQYSTEEHLSWACLIADQQNTKREFACREYLEGEETFEIGDFVIPDYYLLLSLIHISEPTRPY